EPVAPGRAGGGLGAEPDVGKGGRDGERYGGEHTQEAGPAVKTHHRRYTSGGEAVWSDVSVLRGVSLFLPGAPAPPPGPDAGAQICPNRARGLEGSVADELRQVGDEVPQRPGLVEDPVGGVAAPGGDGGRVEGREQDDGRAR